MRGENPTSSNEAEFQHRYESRRRLAGTDIFFRPIRTTDAGLLVELFKSHSEETILHRYFAPLKELPPEQLHRFVDIDYARDMAIVGLAPRDGEGRMICVGRYFRDESGKRAEIAITVRDDYQRHGLGTHLLRELMKAARDMGIECLTAEVMSDNHGMMRLLRGAERTLKTTLADGVYHVEFSPWRERANNA